MNYPFPLIEAEQSADAKGPSAIQFHSMTARDPRIVNALIRCTRGDRAAGPLFELVREDLGLWVLELGYERRQAWSRQIELIADHLGHNRAKLATLKDGSTDYTLHISVQTDDTLPLRIPNKLAGLACECGFEIEIYAEPNHASP